MDTTGWTEVELVIPMNNTAAYIAPIALNISCWESLLKKYAKKKDLITGAGESV